MALDHVASPRISQERHAGILRALSLLMLVSLLGVTPSCKRKANTFAPPPPPAVTVAHPLLRPVTRFIESTGTTQAFQIIDLRARVAGFLEQVNFKPGTTVKQGDLLFVIDKRTYQATVDVQTAQVNADQAAYNVAETDARLADELAQQRAGSEIDRINKAGRRDAAKAAVEASKASLARAKLDLEFCEVRSPIDGRITKNFVDVGNLVGAAGEPTILATIVSDTPIYVTVDASESDFNTVRKVRLNSAPGTEPGQIAPGQWRPVNLATAESTSFDIQGVIDYVDPALNPDTGTIKVRCRFENADRRLVPGMFVRLRFLLDVTDSLLVPDLALLSDQNGRFALVVNEDGSVTQRRVTIGALDGPMRVVLSGLTTSDKVIVKGLQRARPGAVVTPTVEELQHTPGTSSAKPTGEPRV